MTYRGHVNNGQILLDQPASLPEGALVNVEISPDPVRISRPQFPERLQPFQPIEMPGDSLADEIVRDRR